MKGKGGSDEVGGREERGYGRVKECRVFAGKLRPLAMSLQLTLISVKSGFNKLDMKGLKGFPNIFCLNIKW